MTTIALIGGTGLNQLEGMEMLRQHSVETPWGACSHPVQAGRWYGHPVFFLARHGIPRSIPPHRINYRANLWALWELGARDIIAVNAVGGIAPAMIPGHIVLPDQIIDYTWGREHSYYDGSDGQLEHIDFTEPYDAGLRQELIEAAVAMRLPCSTSGTCGVTQGPRLETAAEVRRLGRDGCDVVGMTTMPEAALAAELGLAYASISMVVNPAAGLGGQPVTEAVQESLARGSSVITDLLSAWLQYRQRAEIRSD